MSLIGIIAKKKDILAMKREIKGKDIDVIEITKESIKNIKNIEFEEIIFLENINLEDDEYKYMNDIISKTKYLILNGDIEIDILKEIKIEKPIKLITFGFNSKSTITVSSIQDDKIIVCIQRDIEKPNGKLLEKQEKQMIINNENSKKIYKNLVVFIINELHNLQKTMK